jgi:hypothetical protein
MLTHMITKLFEMDARLGRHLALGISLTALTGCGGKVLDVDADSGKPDSAAVDSATATDTLVLDTFTPPVEDSSPFPTDVASEACPDCVQSNCAAEINACGGSPDCLAVNDCVNACDDDACRNACIGDDSKPGVTTYVNLLECAQAKCSAECF